MNVNEILKEYFASRSDGGVFFDTNNNDQMMMFEQFLVEKGYDTSIINNLWEAEPDEVSNVENYVNNRYRSFFQSAPKETELKILCNLYADFKKLGDESIESAFSFLKNNPYLITYEKNQVGQGEFGIYLLLKDSLKIKVGKGDIQIGELKFEVKKIKKAKEPIRFGTNIDLNSINFLRYVTFGLKNIFSSKEYKDGTHVKEFGKKYAEIMDGSEASITVTKLKELYIFVKNLKQYCELEKKQTNLISNSDENKDFIFKAKAYNKDLFFKVKIDDLKNILNTGKITTEIELTPNSQDTEELNSFSEDVDKLISGFLKVYADDDIFKKLMVSELINKYEKDKIHILIIDETNNFLIDPKNFEYASINQYVRPQVILKK